MRGVLSYIRYAGGTFASQKWYTAIAVRYSHPPRELWIIIRSMQGIPRATERYQTLYVILSGAIAKSKDLGVAAYIIFLRFAGFPGLRSEWRIRLAII